MNIHLVTWKKKYYEDLGEQDENGFFDYAYRYFIYSFYFHNRQEVHVRRYTDTMDECSIFFNSENQKDGESLDKVTIISAVIHFVRTTQVIKKCRYFNSKNEYILMPLTETENALSNFSFIELT